MRQYPQSQNSFIGVAFLRGNTHVIGDQVVMKATWGPFVHTEIFIQKEGDVRFYSASSPLGEGLVPSARLRDLTTSTNLHTLMQKGSTGINRTDKWEIVSFPLSPNGGYEVAYALILQILSMQLPYNSRDLWQCCVQVMLPFESDLDCDNLDTWRKSGVFCSQVCLLILRRLARRGLVALDLENRQYQNLQTVNSRGCSPNSLFNILSARLYTKKKSETTRACWLDERRQLRYSKYVN